MGTLFNFQNKALRVIRWECNQLTMHICRSSPNIHVYKWTQIETKVITRFDQILIADGKRTMMHPIHSFMFHFI